MDKVPIHVMDVKEGRKEERKVRLKQDEEKKRRKSKKMLKNLFKIFIKRKRSKKVSNYICTSLHDCAGQFVHLLMEVSNEGSMY